MHLSSIQQGHMQAVLWLWTSNRLVLQLHSHLVRHRNSQQNKQYSLVCWFVFYIPIIHILNFQRFLPGILRCYSKNGSPVPLSIFVILSTAWLSCIVTTVHHSISYIMNAVWRHNMGSRNFPKIKELLQNLKCQKGDMKQLPYGVPTNITYCCTKLNCQGDLANGICVPQVITKNTLAFSCPLKKLCCSTIQLEITACEYIYIQGVRARGIQKYMLFF